MQLSGTNCENHTVPASIFAQLNSGQNVPSLLRQIKTGPPKFSARDNAKLLMTIEAFIGYELFFVPEVERVFVEREEDGREFRVITVINERDPNVRAKVYEREKAIIEAHRHLYFDFHITARMNRDLKDVVYGVGKRIFGR